MVLSDKLQAGLAWVPFMRPCSNFFMLTWGFGFWMWRLTVARGILFLLSGKYCAVMCGVVPGALVAWPWLRLNIIYCSALRLWSQICVICRSCWFPDSVALSCAGASCLWPEGWLHTYEMITEHFANPLWVCFFAFDMWQNLYVFSLYCDPDLDDRIFLLFTNINGCRTGWGCACLFPLRGRFEFHH